MNLIEKTESQAKAEEVQRLITELAEFSTATLQRIHALVNSRGMEQEILDHFGSKGTEALTAYGAMREVMELVAPGKVPVADPAVFVPREDGSVLFVPPADPGPAV